MASIAPSRIAILSIRQIDDPQGDRVPLADEIEIDNLSRQTENECRLFKGDSLCFREIAPVGRDTTSDNETS